MRSRRPKIRRIRWRRPSRASLGWLAAFAAAAALQVWLNLKTTELGYELAAMRHVIQRLAGERAELEGELASLTSPRALDVSARSRLGLRSPREGQIVGLP